MVGNFRHRLVRSICYIIYHISFIENTHLHFLSHLFLTLVRPEADDPHPLPELAEVQQILGAPRLEHRNCDVFLLSNDLN